MDYMKIYEYGTYASIILIFIVIIGLITHWYNVYYEPFICLMILIGLLTVLTNFLYHLQCYKNEIELKTAKKGIIIDSLIIIGLIFLLLDSIIRIIF